MMLVDANILLYAVNRHDSRHTAIRVWLENAINGDEPVGLAWIVLLAFLRISTNPRAFTEALTPDAALMCVDQWLSHPNTRLVAEGPDHWDSLQNLVRQTGAAGNLTTDAHLAALAISHNARLISCDRDFSGFARLKWQNPLAVV